MFYPVIIILCTYSEILLDRKFKMLDQFFIHTYSRTDDASARSGCIYHIACRHAGIIIESALDTRHSTLDNNRNAFFSLLSTYSLWMQSHRGSFVATASPKDIWFFFYRGHCMILGLLFLSFCTRVDNV